VTLVVNLFAGPGAGKSTTAAGVFSLLKLHGVNCELVREYAKELVWAGRSLDSQDKIFYEQRKRQEDLRGKVDVIITDSPILLSLYYNQGSRIKADEGVVLDAWRSWENESFWVTRVKPYEKAGRLQTEEEARNIDQAIRRLLNDLNVRYKEVPGDLRGINEITKEVLDRLGVRLRFLLHMAFEPVEECFYYVNRMYDLSVYGPCELDCGDQEGGCVCVQKRRRVEEGVLTSSR